MAQVFVSIGTNIEREKHIRAAVHELQKKYGELQLSSVYESKPVGFDGDNFLNMVVGFDTGSDAESLVKDLHAIEDRYGRERGDERFSARSMDLDLLVYDDLILDADNVQIPRDEICFNAFVLQPLAELSPQLCHPVTGESYADMWRRFDVKQQALWRVEFDFALK